MTDLLKPFVDEWIKPLGVPLELPPSGRTGGGLVRPDELALRARRAG
jgi:hypothetical protein